MTCWNHLCSMYWTVSPSWTSHGLSFEISRLHTYIWQRRSSTEFISYVVNLTITAYTPFESLAHTLFCPSCGEYAVHRNHTHQCGFESCTKDCTHLKTSHSEKGLHNHHMSNDPSSCCSSLPSSLPVSWGLPFLHLECQPKSRQHWPGIPHFLLLVPCPCPCQWDGH